MGAGLQAQVGMRRDARVERRLLLPVHRPALDEAERDLRTERDDFEGQIEALQRVRVAEGDLLRVARRAIALRADTRRGNPGLRPAGVGELAPPERESCPRARSR